VVWEMLNKSVMQARPFTVLGDFWQPILERVREVEQGAGEGLWGEANAKLVHSVASAAAAADYLAQKLEVKR